VIAAIVDQIDARAPARATYAGRPGHPVLITRELFAARSAPSVATAGPAISPRGRSRTVCGHLCRPDDVDTRGDLEATQRQFVARAERAAR